MLLALTGAAVVLAASVPTWVTARIADAAGTTTLTASGARSSGTVMPIALAAAAAAFALTLVDGWLRRIVAVVLAGCGVGVALACAAVLADPAAAVGAPGVVPVAASTTVAPWIAIIGSVPLVLGGILALLAGDRWAARSARRTDEVAGGRTSTRQAPTRSAWDALSEGDDPT